MTRRPDLARALLCLAAAAIPCAVGQACSERSTRSPAGADTVDLAGVRVVGALQVPGEIRDGLRYDDRILRVRGTYARAWTLAGRAGQRVVIDLVRPEGSSLYDPYLYITGPGLDSALADDDAGAGCDASISFVPPTDGEYRVIATTFQRQEGAFVLRANRESGRDAGDECDVVLGVAAGDHPYYAPVRGRLRVPGEVSDDLTNEHQVVSYVLFDEELEPEEEAEKLFWAQRWDLEGVAGREVTVELISDAFDPRLGVYGPAFPPGSTRMPAPGTCVARLSLTFPKTGTYSVVVQGQEPRQSSRPLPYVLRASTQQPAPREMECAYLLVPGVRAGPITAATSEEELRRLSRGDIEQVDLGDSDEARVPGTVLYPRSPVARIQIAWTDDGRVRPQGVVIQEEEVGEGPSIWHTARGVRLGTTLTSLELLNGRPFTVAHIFGTGWEARVISWEGGDLAAELDTLRAVVSIASGRLSTLTPDLQRQLEAADRPLSSALPALRRLNPRVTMIWLKFDRP